MKRWLPLCLFLFALLIRLGARWLTHFDGLYGQDPFAYYEYSLTLGTALGNGQPPPPFFWPIGYPLLVTLASFFIGTEPLAGQLVSMICGALLAPLVYLLVLAYHKEAMVGGVMAGLLAATSGQLLLSSLSVMADAASLLWATLSAWAMVRYIVHLRPSDIALASASLAFAILTRWVYALLVIPWGAAALLAWWQTKSSWRQVGSGVVTAVFVGLFILGLHFAADVGRNDLSYVGDLEVYTWSPANAFKRTITNNDGNFTYERPIGLFYAIPSLHPSYVFPFFALFYLPALWYLRRQSPAHIVLLAGWLLVVYFFLAGVTWQNWRFPLSFFPPLLVLVGLGIEWVWQQQPRWHQLLAIAGSLALVGSLLWAARDVYNFTMWKEQQLATATWVSQQLPPESTLIAFGLTNMMQHYTDIPTYELYVLDEANLRQLSGESTGLYLLIDPENVHSQWEDKSPGLNVEWLEAHTELREIGRSHPYVLYQATPQQAAETNNNLFLPAIGD
jgi:4-amino-4-deoxy-L-arabinose transferase-like glycosyltransferase